MGDTTDGSSSAAQSAQPESRSTAGEPASFIDWVLRRRGRKDARDLPRSATELDRTNAAGHRRMLGNLNNMHDMRVEDVSIPRADMVAVAEDIDRDLLIEVFRKSGYSRLPVYGDTPDDPKGLVHLKDIVFAESSDGSAFNLSEHLRPLLYAPPSMPIGALMQKMQNSRMHMALVIDEYGGTDGLVTFEDLVEQIVGEITDEHDSDEDRMWTVEASGSYRAQARADIEDFEAAAGVDLLPDDLDEDVDSLGGLVFMLAGRVPARGELVVHPQGHEFEVLDADPRRIKRLRIRLNDTAGQDRAAE